MITYYSFDFAITDSHLHFLNYIPKLTSGNSHTYRIKLSDGSVEKIA